MSSSHRAVTVIGKFDAFALCAVHNNHNKSVLINAVPRECDILRLFAFWLLKTYLDNMHFKRHHRSRDLCKSECPKKEPLSLSPFDTSVSAWALQLLKWWSDDSWILLVTLQRHDSLRQKLEALMQTRALPKITCHKLSKTKFSVFFFVKLYFLH